MMNKKVLCLACEKVAKRKAEEEGADDPERFVKVFYTTFDEVREEMCESAFNGTNKMYYCSYCENPIHTAVYTEDELNAMYIDGELNKADFEAIINTFDRNKD